MTYPILKFAFNRNYYFDNSWFHAFWYEDYYGNVLSKEKYRYAKSYNEGYAFVYKQDKTWDIINAIGESLIKKIKYSKIIETALGYIMPQNFFFIKNYKVDDNLLISVNWEKLRILFEKQKLDVKYSCYDSIKQGYLVININTGKLSLIEDYSLDGNGFIAIKHFNKNWIFIEVKSFRFHALEKKAFDTEFEHACGFKNGLAKVKVNGTFGFLNTKGEFAIEPIFDDARSFFEGYAAVAVANCRKDVKIWNRGKRFSDLAWNFINKSKVTLLKECKELLSMIDSDKSFYYKNNSDCRNNYETRNLNRDYLVELSRCAAVPASYSVIDRPSSDYWYSSNIWGQLHADYIVDLLTAQISDELGFKKWFVDMNFKRTSAYNYIQSREKVIAESIYIDFDTTQTEFDYILGTNSLEAKYRSDYSSDDWKSKESPNYYSLGPNELDIDWSNYNDNLDMDQQSIDFWNQF